MIKKNLKRNLKRDWPIEEGRYRVGNAEACVAVCTEATVGGLKLDMEKVAICGKCVTENVGVEKIVKNLIVNANIRFLIVCGKESKGHNVGQTLLALGENGVDKNKRVIGSTGSIPVLKHLSFEEIAAFRRQIEVVDMRGVTDSRRVMMKVKEINKNMQISKYANKQINKQISNKQMRKTKKIQARVDDKKYVLDPKGSFCIRIDKKRKVIVAEHYNSDFELDLIIEGKTAHSITDTIIKKGLIGDYEESLDHAAYLGREMVKAEWCLVHGVEYEQDMEIRKVKSQKSKVKSREKDEFGWI